jgi:transcriptional antiterminator NusG
MAQRWYVIHVHSGFEKRVQQTIMEKAQKDNIVDLISEVLVPSEEVVELKKGTKVKSERRFFPGYVLARMEMNDQTWHFIKAIPKVSGFLGNRGKPTPIADKEAIQIMNNAQERSDKARSKVIFEVGEQVRVCDGPFSSFNGSVEEVDEERTRLKVAVSIFGRSTPVELDFTQVEKIKAE